MLFTENHADFLWRNNLRKTTKILKFSREIVSRNSAPQEKSVWERAWWTLQGVWVAVAGWGSYVDFRGRRALPRRSPLTGVPSQEPIYGRWPWHSRPHVKGRQRRGPLRSLPEGKGKPSAESLDNTLRVILTTKYFLRVMGMGRGRGGVCGKLITDSSTAQT